MQEECKLKPAWAIRRETLSIYIHLLLMLDFNPVY